MILRPASNTKIAFAQVPQRQTVARAQGFLIQRVSVFKAIVVDKGGAFQLMGGRPARCGRLACRTVIFFQACKFIKPVTSTAMEWKPFNARVKQDAMQIWFYWPWSLWTSALSCAAFHCARVIMQRKPRWFVPVSMSPFPRVPGM
jgi:hypothetical protein